MTDEFSRRKKKPGSKVGWMGDKAPPDNNKPYWPRRERFLADLDESYPDDEQVQAFLKKVRDT